MMDAGFNIQSNFPFIQFYLKWDLDAHRCFVVKIYSKLKDVAEFQFFSVRFCVEPVTHQNHNRRLSRKTDFYANLKKNSSSHSIFGKLFKNRTTRNQRSEEEKQK